MTDKEIHARISDNLKKYRKLRNLPQAQLADSIGMSKESIKGIISDAYRDFKSERSDLK